MGFCCVDWDIDDEEGAGGIWVWDSGLVWSDVEVVCCGFGEEGGCWELHGQGGVPFHLHGFDLHFEWRFDCRIVALIELNFFCRFALGTEFCRGVRAAV